MTIPSAQAIALSVALAAAAVTAVAVTPATLLPAPERPFATYSHTVRTGPASFPREAWGPDDLAARVAASPRRIVSQSMSSDEFLYTVVPPERIVGVSEAAYLEGISNVYEMTRVYAPVVANDVERVLRTSPDLVFNPAEGRSDMPALLRAAGTPVYRMPTMFRTVDSIEEHIRLVGYLTGEDDRAEHAARSFRETIDRAARRRPAGAPRPRVLGLGGAYSYGSETLFTDILRVVGAENVAATHGFVGYDRIADEHIIEWNPEWIVAGADRGFVNDVRRRLLEHPATGSTTAARRGQIVVFENRMFLAMSPLSAAFVDALAAALYGDRS